MATKFQLEQKYDAAKAVWKERCKVWTKARDAYRARTINDSEYLAAREAWNEAQAEFDEAETAFINNMNAMGEEL